MLCLGGMPWLDVRTDSWNMRTRSKLNNTAGRVGSRIVLSVQWVERGNLWVRDMVLD